MRSAPIFAAALLTLAMLAPPAVAFDVQNGGGGQAAGSSNLAADPSNVPGVSLDSDLRAQLGLAEDKAAAGAARSGLQFGGGVFSGSGSAPGNQTTMGYDERPWVAPRARAGRD
jgi:hypothetical protein